MDKFDKPTNTWIEEEIEITKYTPTQEGGQTKFKKEIVKVPQKTMYVDSPAKRVMCPTGQHYFFCIDKHKYIFACRYCQYKRQVFPVSYRYEDGKLINKETNEPL